MEVFTLGWRENCTCVFANFSGPPEKGDGPGPPALTPTTLSCASLTHTHTHSAWALSTAGGMPSADPAVLPSSESLSWPPLLRLCDKSTLNPSACPRKPLGLTPGQAPPPQAPFLVLTPCGSLTRPSPGLQAANTVAPGSGLVQAPPGPSSPLDPAGLCVPASPSMLALPALPCPGPPHGHGRDSGPEAPG